MAAGVIVGLVDDLGRLLMQERDENAPVDPNRWSLVGGQVESGESTLAAARRELEEETGIVTEDLRTLGTHTLPCAVHGEDDLELFTAPTSATDADVHCGEGRQIIFINPDEIEDLDLTSATRALYRTVLAAHPRRVPITPVTARQPELPQFDRLFLEAVPAVLNQQHRRETPPVDGGRWPVSVVVFPEATIAITLNQVMDEALQLAGPGHFHTGLAGSSHFTVRALEYYRDDVGADDAAVVRYRRAMQLAAHRCGPIALHVTGLTLTLGTVMAAATPVDDEADRFMDALKDELKQDAWHEADFRRDIWYLNVLHFASDVDHPQRLVEWVRQRRRLDLGVTHADRAHLVRFRYANTNRRPRMRPEIFGEAVLDAGTANASRDLT